MGFGNIEGISSLTRNPGAVFGSEDTGKPGNIFTRNTEILKGVSGGLAALSIFHKGVAEAAELNVQAEFEDINAEAEFTNALNRSNTITEATNRLQGAARAGYAANGFDVGATGTVGRFQEEVSARSGFATSSIKLAGNIRRQKRRLNAINLRIEAKNRRRAGILGAIFSIFGTASSILTAGVGGP